MRSLARRPGAGQPYSNHRQGAWCQQLARRERWLTSRSGTTRRSAVMGIRCAPDRLSCLVVLGKGASPKRSLWGLASRIGAVLELGQAIGPERLLFARVKRTAVQPPAPQRIASCSSLKNVATFWEMEMDMARANLSSMSFEALLRLREEIGDVLNQKAVQLQNQLSKLCGDRQSGQTKLYETPEDTCQISRQGGQHLGRPRCTARMAAREAQGRCQTRTLCCSKSSGLSQSSLKENKEASTQEVRGPVLR
jgi:hypothetical protein